VFGVFNATIPKNEKSSELTVGTEVAFKVVGMDVRSLPIMINGKLLTEKQLRKKVEKRAHREGEEEEHENASKKTEENSEEPEKEEQIAQEEPAEEPPKKRRKHKTK